MEDIGSLIFYIVLGIIALAGSFQGKGKKKTGVPKTVQRKPETAAPIPQARRETVTTRPQPVAAQPYEPAPAPKYIAPEPTMEGRYDEPLAGEFGREGSYEEPMAREFDWEGDRGEPLAKDFSREGSIPGRMAAAFASEGVSAFGSSVSAEFIHNEISDTEISDAPEYDYNVAPGSGILTDGFDLRKAVIYSSVLDRKEYSY